MAEDDVQARAERFRAVAAAAKAKLDPAREEEETVWSPPAVVSSIPKRKAKLESGTVIDQRYTLKTLIGRGGHGEVWSASDSRTPNQQVALKLLHPHVAAQQKLVERIAREATVLSRLDHPSIARALGFGVTKDHVYLALELVEGQPLHHWLQVSAERRHVPSTAWISRVVTDIGAAIAAAHAAGIVHRDVKPQNVLLVGAEGRESAKVLDFGIAVVATEDPFDETTQGRRVGSPLYMSPEQVAGLEVGPAVDQFAFATLVFEMLTMRRAWAVDEDGRLPTPWDVPVPKVPGNTLLEVTDRISRGTRPRATAFRPTLDPAVDAVLVRAWSRKPQERFGSIQLFVSALTGALHADSDEVTASEDSEDFGEEETIPAGSPPLVPLSADVTVTSPSVPPVALPAPPEPAGPLAPSVAPPPTPRLPRDRPRRNVELMMVVAGLAIIVVSLLILLQRGG